MTESMKKAELIAKVSETTGMSTKAVRGAVDAMFETISQTVKQRETVTIGGFGTFSARTRAAREGKDPSSGATIQIAEKTNGFFKPAKPLRDISA